MYYSASAICCVLISSSVSGRGISVFCAFSTYAVPLAYVTEEDAYAALPPSRNAALARVIVFFH